MCVRLCLIVFVCEKELNSKKESNSEKGILFICIHFFEFFDVSSFLQMFYIGYGTKKKQYNVALWVDH